jgi:hypothetical protein
MPHQILQLLQADIFRYRIIFCSYKQTNLQVSHHFLFLQAERFRYYTSFFTYCKSMCAIKFCTSTNCCTYKLRDSDITPALVTASRNRFTYPTSFFTLQADTDSGTTLDSVPKSRHTTIYCTRSSLLLVLTLEVEGETETMRLCRTPGGDLHRFL